jgi:hypothetical protein
MRARCYDRERMGEQQPTQVTSDAAAEPNAPANQAYRLGTLRIVLNAPPEKPTPGFKIGTLRIQLAGKPEKPKPAPVAAPPANTNAGLHEVGMHDDTLDAVGDNTPLEIDESALGASTQVSGGRPRGQAAQASTHAASEPPEKAPRKQLDTTTLVHRVLLGLSLAISVIFGAVIVLRSREPEAAAPAPTAAGVAVAQVPGAAAAAEVDGVQEGPVHPLLSLTPQPMKPSLASVLRKNVSGVQKVTVTWSGPAVRGSVECMLVSGNANEREARVQRLLATGRRLTLPPEVENQMRDHIETMRVAAADEKANFTPLCLAI